MDEISASNFGPDWSICRVSVAACPFGFAIGPTFSVFAIGSTPDSVSYYCDQFAADGHVSSGLAFVHYIALLHTLCRLHCDV